MREWRIEGEGVNDGLRLWGGWCIARLALIRHLKEGSGRVTPTVDAFTGENGLQRYVINRPTTL